MRVLQINSVCGIGSTGRIATDIHAILKEQGHESYIAYGRGNAINCDSAIRIGNKYDNYSHVLKTRIFDKHGFGSKRATKEFIAKVKELDPDVIHLHNIHGYYINVEILFDYLKEANKPVVWTLHDCWAFTGHCTHFEYVGCDCWRNDSTHKCSQKYRYPASFFINNSRNNYRRKRNAFKGVRNLTIVTPSMWLANIVGETFLRDYSVKVINNGIDLNVFKPTSSDFLERNDLLDKFIILGVASVWNDRKGLNYFLELSKKLQDNEVIVLVGLSDNQKKRLPKNIIGFTKTSDVQELAKIYTAANIFVNPTLEDNFPTTNLEALACGLPVITFNTGGSIESIDNKTGIIVKKGDVNGLYNAIFKYRRGKTQLNKQYCLERASKNYNKDKKFKEYLQLYKKLLKGECG